MRAPTTAAARAGRACAAVVVVAACAAAATSALARSQAASVRERLPDLLQVSPYYLSGTTVRTASGPRFRLGFSSAVVNTGVGPLEILGSRRSTASATMTATQIVHRSDGTTVRYPNVGRLRFVVSETHRHWHFLGFEQYELLRAKDRRVVRRDAKTGFCLGDRYNAFPGSFARPGQRKKAFWTGSCEKNRRSILRVHEGISVGYGDDYKPQVEGQYVDVTGLPGGVYELVHRVNVDRRLRESAYGNNVASILVRLSWPQGRAASPRIVVLRRCGDGRRCRQG